MSKIENFAMRERQREKASKSLLVSRSFIVSVPKYTFVYGASKRQASDTNLLLLGYLAFDGPWIACTDTLILNRMKNTMR